MKNKVSKLLGLILFVMSTHSLAQQCPQPLGNLDVQINVEPLRYEYQYTSRQIQSVKENTNQTLLGLYSGNKAINIQPSFKITQLAPNSYCMSVSSSLVRVNITPIIYIAKESQQFPCTKQRVEQHELLHFQFELNAASKAKSIIEKMANKYFNQQFYVLNQQEVNQVSDILKKRGNDFMNEIGNYFEKNTTPLHDKIDSQENYKYESSFCSVQENAMLNKLLELKY